MVFSGSHRDGDVLLCVRCNNAIGCLNIILFYHLLNLHNVAICYPMQS
jgi:hypothetical protein